MLYATGKMSINKIAKTFGMCWSLVYRWIMDALKHQIERWTNETLDMSPNCKIVLTAIKCDLIDRFDRDRLQNTLQHTAQIMH